MDGSIGKDWKDRIKSDEQDKENRKNRINGQFLEFDPPEKMPKNSPSYLIWSIFTKEREERARRALQSKSPAGQQSNNTGAGVAAPKGVVSKSAPARPDSRANQAQPVKE